MAKVCVISLGSESAPHIAECVRQELGDRSASEEWETSKAPVLVVVVECESDGEPCPAARQFVYLSPCTSLRVRVALPYIPGLFTFFVFCGRRCAPVPCRENNLFGFLASSPGRRQSREARPVASATPQVQAGRKMAKVCVISLGSESAPHIAECVRQELGDRSASEEWETSKAPVLVVVVECESDGEPCPAARQFVRALRRSECFANYSQSIGRRAAVLGLASSVCANSAAQLGDGDKYTGASRVERALIAGGCTALLKMGTMEACPAPSSQAISISLPLPSASLPHCLCSPALLTCHGGLVSAISSTPLPSDRRRRWSCRVPRRVLFRGPEPSARR